MNRGDLSSGRSFIVPSRRMLPYNSNSGNELSTGQGQSRKIGEMEPFALTFPLAFRESCRAGRINFSRRSDSRPTRPRRNPRLSARVDRNRVSRAIKVEYAFVCATRPETVFHRRGIACHARFIITLVIISAAFRHIESISSELFGFLFPTQYQQYHLALSHFASEMKNQIIITAIYIYI